MTDTFLGAPDFKRDRWGRPQIVVPGEDKPVAYARPSGFGQVLENQSGLTTWKIRTAIGGACDRPDLLNLFSAYRTDDKKVRDIVEQLLEAGGASKAANTGTAIHDIVAQVNQGRMTLDEVPTQFRGHVEAWLNEVDRLGFEIVPELVERHLVNDEYQVAGSGDVFLRYKSNGKLVAVDLKTGKSISPRPLAYMVQLYLYANSQLYDVETGERTPLGDVETSVAYIAHLPAAGGGCTFYSVDLEAAKVLTDLAVEVRKAEKQTVKVNKIEPLAFLPEQTPAPVEVPLLDERRTWIRKRLELLVGQYPHTKAEIAAKWPTGVPTFKSGHAHTDGEIDIIDAVLVRIEAEYGVPFGASDPKVVAARAESTRWERKIKEVFPGARVVDDESEMDERSLVELQRHIAELPVEQQMWIKARVDESVAAKKSVSLKQNRTRRRFEIVQALSRLSDFHDAEDVVRAFIQIIKPTAKTTSKIGAVLGGFDFDEALRLQKLSDAIDEGVLVLTWDDDANPKVLGDMSVISTD